MVEIGRWQQFQVETGLSRQSLWHGLVENDAQFDRAPAPLGANDILPVMVGIAQCCFNNTGLGVHLPLDQRTDRIPLSGRGRQSHVTVGHAAQTLLDDFYAADLRIRKQAIIPVGEGQYIDRRPFEIAFVVQLERRFARRLRYCRYTAQQQCDTGKGPSETPHVSLLLIALPYSGSQLSMAVSQRSSKQATSNRRIAIWI